MNTTARAILARNILRFACLGICRAPLRSGLTAFSLVIGVAAVIATIGIGNGARARVQESIAGLDMNRLSMGARLPLSGGPIQYMFPRGSGLTIDDYHAIRHEIPELAAVSPVLRSAYNSTASVAGHSVQVALLGIDVDGFLVQSRKIMRGAFFGADDVSSAANVCAVSESVVQALFPNAEPIGGLLRIDNSIFRIIGIVGDKVVDSGADSYAKNPNAVLVPYTSMLQRIDNQSDSALEIHMRARTPEFLPFLGRQVSELMERRRGKRIVEFSVLITADMAASYKTSSNTLSLLLALIAAISLVVGGVGIMNVMLMSVNERTREIGIRAALGARGRDILGQILVEAVFLSLLGGLVGVVLGVGSAGAVSRWNGWPMLITPVTIAVAFALSAAIGIFFGYYPARKAAGLNPIESLRSE